MTAYLKPTLPFFFLLMGFVLLPTAGSAQDQDTFQLGDGRFEIKGRKPAGFTEFRYMYLDGATLKAAKGQRLLPQPPGTVKGEFYGKQKFRIHRGVFEGETITVETVAVKGVSFRFQGRVSNGLCDDRHIIEPQFKGILTRLVNGKKTTEAQVTFQWLEPEI
jgi:hypothetical protein